MKYIYKINHATPLKEIRIWLRDSIDSDKYQFFIDMDDAFYKTDRVEFKDEEDYVMAKLKFG